MNLLEKKESKIWGGDIILYEDKKIKKKKWRRNREWEGKSERFKVLNVLKLFVDVSRLVNSTGFFC